MADGLNIRARGLRQAVRLMQATEQQLFRASRNAGSQTTTATRRRAVKQIGAGTKLKSKVIRERLPTYRAKLAEFRATGIAGKIVPIGPRRKPVPLSEYRPRPVAPPNPRYAKNTTRRAVRVKLYVDEPEQLMGPRFFINPKHDRKQVYRRRANGQHVPALYGPPMHVQFDRILPDLEPWAAREYRQRFAEALRKQQARGRRR